MNLFFDAMLRLTYSSELGAATAYAGHAPIAWDTHRAHVEQVRQDELHHRDELLAMLEARGCRPWWWLDAFFFAFGSAVALGCRVWGHRASALGASLFEVNGVSEYRRLARMAAKLGDPALEVAFCRMAEQEQAHRDLFREMSRGASAQLPVLD